MQCSPEQGMAIKSRGQNLLIAAAAGSGKTSVLVERIIRRVIDPQEKLNIDQLLVVTFTNAAANEMRSRIQEALSNVLATGHFESETLRLHIRKQLTLLNAASISTLHSFCQSILRQYFYHIGLDQNFRVGNKTEIELMKNDIMEELLETEYTAADPDLLLLADNYGGDTDDSQLSELILKLYEFSRSHPWPDCWLKNLTKPFDIPADSSFEQTVWINLLKDKILLELELSRLELETLIEEAGSQEGFQIYSDTFSQDLELIYYLTDACQSDFEELRKSFSSHKFPRLPGTPKDADQVIKKNFQERRTTIKNRIKKITETYLTRSSTELIGDLRAAAPEVAALSGITRKFAQKFAAAKKIKNLVDFSDLEHLALKILRFTPPAREAESQEPIVANELRNKYKEIMIDEYQDTNLVQEEILQLLASKEHPNLFMVGDVKQSIYRFRLAEPGLFMAKYATYHKTGANIGSPGRRIDLSCNFRSRAGIIDGVNFIFDRLMSKRTAEIEYAADERLNSGSKYPPSQEKTLEGPIELCLVDVSDSTASSDEEPGTETSTAETYAQDDLDNSEELDIELSGFEQESIIIAQKIQDLVNSGYHTYDKQIENYRPLIYRDIVVLLRSDQGKAAVMMEILRQKDIPSYAQMDTGYFKETEVSIVLSLLNIIDNPRQDIHLAAVLRSPLVGLDVETLAKIRLNKPEGDLWQALIHTGEIAEAASSENINSAQPVSPAAIAKIKLFLKRHENWRTLARRKDVANLIHSIYEETHIYDYVGGMPGGALRQANLTALYERAREFQNTNYRGLFRFLRFISKLKESGSDLAIAKALGEGENVVRIMSIHKSKGLEFPVVIVADLGKKFNLRDVYSLVLCHKELGIAPYVNLAQERLRYPNPARWAISHKIELESKAEELRVLYVALTRAREKLILVGSSKKPIWDRENLLNHFSNRNLRPHPAQILKAKSYLELICLALNQHPDRKAVQQGDFSAAWQPSGQETLFKIIIYPSGHAARESAETEDSGPIWSAIKKGLSLPDLTKGETDWADTILSWNYPYKKAVGKPAKLTVSEIKRRLEFEKEAVNSPVEYLPGIIPQPEPVLRPQFLQKNSGLTKIEYGVALHTLLQHIALDGDLKVAGIAAQAVSLAKKELLLPNHIEALNYEKIAGFFASGLGQRLLKSSKVWRELPFSLLLDAGAFYPELKNSGEQVFIQGVIDCMFAEGEEITLIDYKTDKASSKDELANKYAAQISMYSLAIESILGLKVKEQYIYSFFFSDAIELPGWG